MTDDIWMKVETKMQVEGQFKTLLHTRCVVQTVWKDLNSCQSSGGCKFGV